ncbi:unnamed protein product [Boreogadus saida]
MAKAKPALVSEETASRVLVEERKSWHGSKPAHRCSSGMPGDESLFSPVEPRPREQLREKITMHHSPEPWTVGSSGRGRDGYQANGCTESRDLWSRSRTGAVRRQSGQTGSRGWVMRCRTNRKQRLGTLAEDRQEEEAGATSVLCPDPESTLIPSIPGAALLDKQVLICAITLTHIPAPPPPFVDPVTPWSHTEVGSTRFSREVPTDPLSTLQPDQNHTSL